MLSKIIIPRIGATMTYISSEMEEQAREETFRLKRVKQNKVKQAEKDNKKDTPLVLCNILKRENEEDNKTICPVCTLQDLTETTRVAPQKTNDEDVEKHRLEILLQHVNEIVKTLAERPSKNTDKLLESYNMFIGTIESFDSSTLLKPKDSTPSAVSLKVDSAKYAGDSDICCKNMQGKDIKPMNAIRETVSEFHQRCVAGPCFVCSPGEKTPTGSDYHKKILKEPQKEKLADETKKRETKKSPSNICSCQRNKGRGQISVATDAVWKDAATSTTGLEVVPNRPQSKSALENTNITIKIIAKPSPSRNRSSRQNYDENYFDTKSFVCKRCSKNATKKAMSQSNMCSKCQTSHERIDNKASRRKCPLCDKKKEKKKPSCPYYRDTDSNDSSMSEYQGGVSLSSDKSEYQGGVSLSSDKSKCILARKERKDEAQVWKDAVTSTTGLEVVSSKPQSKSALKNNGMPIKILAKPPPSRNRSSRQSFDENYSDTDGYVCKRCSKAAIKKAVSESNICSNCQTSHERRHSKASKSTCPLCDKEEEIQKPNSIDSSMSEYQGGVSLSSVKSKCILAGKERKDEAQSSTSSLTNVISYLKMKIFGEVEKDEKPCACCGVSKAEEKSKVDCIMCKKELSLSDSDSLCNCCQTETEPSKSRTSTVGTQTSSVPTPKRSCKFDDVVKVNHISDSEKAVEEVCEVCSQSSNTKDIGVNTKPADRFDVRPLNMLLRRKRPKVCTVCRSEIVIKRIHKPVRKARSLNL